MNRREFLKYQAQGALALAGASLLPSLALAEASGPPDLAVATGAPGAAARAAINLLGGMSAFIKPGQRVVIKPNMSFAAGPEQALTTHPDLVRELVILCLEAGAADVRVLDHPLRSAELCLQATGVREACRGLGKDLVFLLDSPSMFAEIEFPKGREMKRNLAMKEVLAADALIAAPVAKSHGSAGVSLSLKGMMGLIWDRSSMHGRYDLSQSIVDLNTRLKATLTVIDATRVLSSNGPSGPGKILTPNTVIASADPVVADAYAVAAFEWWGRRLKPDQVAHLRLAHEQGLGRIDVDKLRVGMVRG
jgi:uncharacterized protein (DUF362 family)